MASVAWKRHRVRGRGCPGSGQLACLWDLSSWFHGRIRDTLTSNGRLTSENFSTFCLQGHPLG